MQAAVLDALKRTFAPRPEDAHKGTFGQTVILGGCKNYVGAPKFAAKSANEIANTLINSGLASMLCGTGTSVVALPDFLAEAVYGSIEYSAVFPLKSKDGFIQYDGGQIDALISRATAFAIGMGAGDGDCKSITEHILMHAKQNIVVDADALYQCRNMKFGHRAVLTPHMGEMGRILNLSVAEVSENGEQICKSFAAEHQCVVILKSAISILSDGNHTIKCDFGNNKLAKGGSGDVLSGIIAGLMSFGTAPFDAAICGTYILGRCAHISDVNEFSHLPTDVISCIPRVIDEILKYTR